MVRGVTAFEGADEGLLPTLFCATTVKVYDVPLTRLLITQFKGP